MQARGWLASDWGISDKGRRAKYYRLRPEGGKALEEEERRWSASVNKLCSEHT